MMIRTLRPKLCHLILLGEVSKGRVPRSGKRDLLVRRNHSIRSQQAVKELLQSLREVGITSYPVDYGIIGSSKLITMKLSFFRS